MSQLPEYINSIPNLAGSEAQVEAAIATARDQKLYLSTKPAGTGFGQIRAACAIALHMHQPLIPAGGADLRTAALISNLKHMMDNQGVGDNHNAPVFVWCYKRIGEFIPALIHEGKQPRVMLEYSGTLLHGMRQMGLGDVFDTLRTVTCDSRYRHAVEWLACPWGHAVAPSTPIQDYRLHVRAWQHHFAAIFGLEALGRVRGFSPSEMALPNHPDVAYEFVKTLKDCGLQWVLVQEHSVEQPANGLGPDRKHLPHRLICKNSRGESAEIIALIKTQGSDTKLVAQMQPFYEAKSLSRWELASRSVPPLVTQIADGENGGVMMNEFPAKFHETVREASGSDIPLMNGSEYLEHLFAAGIKISDLPTIQPIFQKMIWDRMSADGGPSVLSKTIEDCKKADHRFHMEGGSWTNNISWVHGYDALLGPMEKVSSLFNETILKRNVSTNEDRYRNVLLHLMSSQTSCYRYWGQGIWPEYGKEICRRVEEIIKKNYC
jgi:hypothetical protein